MKKKKDNTKRAVPKGCKVTVADLLHSALEQHQRGDLQQAEVLYKKILDAAPDQADALHYLGVIRYQQNALEEAKELILQAIEIHPIADMYKNLAVVLSARNDWRQAVSALEHAVAMEPQESAYAFSLSTAQRMVGDWEACRTTLRALHQRYPEWPEVMLNLANAEKELGNPQEAERLLKRAIEVRPDFAAAHSVLGAHYAETDRLELAVEHNQTAATLEPDAAVYHFNLGNAYLSARRNSDALRTFERAVALMPGHTSSWVNLGATRQLVGDLDGAIAAYSRVIELDPGQAKPYINLGALALLLRRHEQSLAYLKQGIEREPDNFTAWVSAADALTQIGRTEDAINACREALRIEPTYGRGWVLLAKLLMDRNQLAEAEQAIASALRAPIGMGIHVQAADRRMDAYLLLATLRTLQGEAGQAKAAFAAAIAHRVATGTSYSSRQGLAKNVRLILLHPVGRSGSLFLHSLIDSHPQISTLPAVLFKGFFGEGIWDGLYPGKEEPDWRDVLIKRFVARFAPYFDASSPLPVPGNPLGEPTAVGRGLGLCEMGKDRDAVLKVDVEKFSGLLRVKLQNFDDISAPDFFQLIHETHDEMLGWPSQKPVCFFHIHNPDSMELVQTLAGYDDIQFLNIVRQPVQAVESWMKLSLAVDMTPEKLLQSWGSAVIRLEISIRQASHIAFEIYPSATIRLEDIKRQPDKALPALAAWMGVEDHPCLRQPTFAGLEYDAPASTPVKGFETSNLDRKPGALFSEHDQRVMNLLLYPIAVQYGYREADPAYLECEIAWFKPLVSEPLDFEKKILAQLAAMGYQKDASGPRRHFESIAQRCIHLLEQFGTYPAMAPWLKVD